MQLEYILYINSISYVWVKTLFPQLSPWGSFVFNHAVFQIDVLLLVQRTIISTRQLLGGCQASAVLMCKAAERLLSFKCQNDSPPPSWLQLCRETRLTHVELPWVRDHTCSYRDTDHTDWLKWAASLPNREMFNGFFMFYKRICVTIITNINYMSDYLTVTNII